tara:strand:- start:2620 stop:2925 length:306 start_codon:yes stop_codon:yes gene_type:complete
MFEEINVNDVITFKLSNGEEVIATYMKFNPDSIEIRKGLVLMQGPQGIALGTFFSTADPEKAITINKNHVMSVADLNPKLLSQYNNVFNKIKTNPKPSIIT